MNSSGAAKLLALRYVDQWLTPTVVYGVAGVSYGGYEKNAVAAPLTLLGMCWPSIVAPPAPVMRGNVDGTDG